MAKQVRVMISSKCATRWDPSDAASPVLTEIRRRIKKMLEDERVLGEQIFDVWINEDAPAAAGGESATQHCLSQVRESDIVLVLFNGDSGWATPGGIGICHAEYQQALDFAPNSLRVLEIAPRKKPAEPGDTDAEFQRQVDDDNLFRKAGLASEPELLQAVAETIYEAVCDLVAAGSTAARGASYYVGEPLAWARMDYDRRSAAMVTALARALGRANAIAITGDEEAFTLDIAGRSVLFRLHAVPAAMSVATARERVGQPFLRDHEQKLVVDGKALGPVHLIACYQGVSEAQALRQLGFPDAMILTTPFGVYVADGIQRVQMVFLKECRDAANTIQRCDELLTWLRSQREDRLMAERAARRAAIVKEMAST